VIREDSLLIITGKCGKSQPRVSQRPLNFEKQQEKTSLRKSIPRLNTVLAVANPVRVQVNMSITSIPGTVPVFGSSP